MLSLDGSGSMIATDVYPGRIEAAKKTATKFVRALPAGAKVGLVKFSTHATLVTPPTDDHDRVIAALAELRPKASTTIGDGLLKAVFALPGRGGFDRAPAGDPPAAAGDPATLPPAAVVLMSEGGNNTGSPPDQAALVARRLHVIVHTVGLGSPQGATPDVESHAPNEALDETTLKKIAAATDGTYHRAASEAELARAYSGSDAWWPGSGAPKT
jgi:Ca-activated chloride channel family protein